MTKKGQGKGKPKPAPAARPVSEGDSPRQPGYPLPARAPSYRDLTPAQQRGIDRSMAEAGRKAYGRPIRMQDAVASRVTQIKNAIARAPGGVPNPEWYDAHVANVEAIARRHGLPIGSAIDTSATLSTRNRPSNELLALDSAAFIATNPGHVVHISEQMAPFIGDIKKVPQTGGKKGNVSVVTNPVEAGPHTLGSLSPSKVASIAFAANKTDTESFKGVSDVTNRSAGRDVAARAIQVARGSTFDEVAGASPKVRNYARAQHLASPQFSEYDKEVLSRISKHDPSQGLLFRASELLGDKKPPQETVEDYIGHFLTSQAAAEKGNTGATAKEAQNIVKPPKVGKNKAGEKVQNIPVNWEPDEAAHAFNEEATIRASEQVGYHGWGPDGEDFYEHITPKGAQVVQWVETQRHVLNEDNEYKKQLKAQEEARKAEEKKKAKEEAAAKASQPTIPGIKW